MVIRTESSTVNTATRVAGQWPLTNENILLDVNWINIFDVNWDQIYVIGGLVPWSVRTDQFDTIITVRS